ncbi:MAG: dihydrofolate reductase family protein [Acidimicrobiales bacterium]
MRKLVLQMAAISLDGYICEEGTEFWRSFGPAALPAAPDDDEYEEYFLSLMRRAGSHIMGRVTYESMAATWPTSSDPVAAIMNDVPKVVFFQTLQSADWAESRIARGDTAEEIARLKAEPGGEIVAHGGARFVQSLAGLGLVDEYRLYVHPVATGGGTPLFPDVGHPRGLRLLSSRAFQCGVLALAYRPITPRELEAVVPAPDTGREVQASLDASRARKS